MSELLPTGFREGAGAGEVVVSSNRATSNQFVLQRLMKRVKASNNLRVQWFVVGLLFLVLTSCSLQKRTTMPGWHWEHEKITFHQGPSANAETFLKDRGHLVNLSSRGAGLQSEVDLSRTLQVSAPTSLPKSDVEAMNMLSASELDEVSHPSALMRASVPLNEEAQKGTTEEAPNEWLVAALITLGFGLMMLPSPIAGVFIGLAPFIFSLGQLVRLSREEKALKKKSRGKKFGYILLMLASVFITIGLTSFLNFAAVANSVAGAGWSFTWSYTGPG